MAAITGGPTSSVIELTNTVYALDSTTIALCLSVFPWAHFRTTKAAVKMHTLLDLRGNIPASTSWIVATSTLMCCTKPGPAKSNVQTISLEEPSARSTKAAVPRITNQLNLFDF